MKSRTTLATIASVVAIAVTAGSAVGANLGILRSADSGPVGHLTIADLTVSPDAITIPVAPETTTIATTIATTSTTTVDANGSTTTRPLAVSSTHAVDDDHPDDHFDDDHPDDTHADDGHDDDD